jgi:hypothetical protein
MRVRWPKVSLAAGVILSLAGSSLTDRVVALDLPDLDVTRHCRAEAAKGFVNGPPRRPRLDFESLLELCLRSEMSFRRNVKWRLPTFPAERGQECIDFGIRQGSYRAMTECLDRFGLPLR